MSIENNKLKLVVAALVMLMVLPSAFAGNKDRIGSSGAEQLKINPWARGAGYANANSASAVGVEATFLMEVTLLG